MQTRKLIRASIGVVDKIIRSGLAAADETRRGSRFEKSVALSAVVAVAGLFFSLVLIPARSDEDNDIHFHHEDNDRKILAEIASLRTEVSSLRSRVSGLRDEVGTLQTSNSGFQTGNSALETRLAAVESNRTLQAYDLYLRAKELLVNVRIASIEEVRKPLVGAIALLDRTIDVDPKFTLAYCRLAEAHDLLYYLYDHTPEQRNLADAAISRALASEPDQPEVQLIYAEHLYYAFRDYERAREHLAIAKRDLPNDTEAIALEAFMDRRQGHWENAIQELARSVKRPFADRPWHEH